jgi:hypothetical protein
MSREQIELRIAEGVYQSERVDAAALGHDGIDICLLSVGAFCGVLTLACDPDRPAVLTRFRPIVRRSAHGRL